MNVCKWLEQVKKLDQLINAKLAEREQLWSMATRVVPSMDGMPHGTNVADPVGNAVEKLVLLGEEINKLIDQYIDQKNQVVATLEKLPPLEYGVLHRYYVQYMTWEEVANDMGYCTVQIWRIKNNALKKLEDVIECYTIHVV